MRKLSSRDEIPMLIDEMGLTGMGVEVGAGSGSYSRQILANCKLKRFFSIDPWNKPEGPEGESIHHLAPPAMYIDAVQKLMPFGLRSVVLRMYSLDAAELFQPGSLDFVYIDAQHWYPRIAEDLRVWWPKVRPGGLFAGHDYCEYHGDVVKAVQEHVDKYHLELFTTDMDFVFNGHEIRSWLIQKDKKDVIQKGPSNPFVSFYTGRIT